MTFLPRRPADELDAWNAIRSSMQSMCAANSKAPCLPPAVAGVGVNAMEVE